MWFSGVSRSFFTVSQYKSMSHQIVLCRNFVIIISYVENKFSKLLNHFRVVYEFLINFDARN
eukprot:UN25904